MTDDVWGSPDRTAILREMLRNGIVRVEFEKLNGSKRTMLATLDPKRVPMEGQEETAFADGEPTSDLFVVWDTEIDQWRSFRASHVYSVTAV